MVNSKFGDEHVVETILEQVAAHEKRAATPNVTASA
jgi:hypothetical protein